VSGQEIKPSQLVTSSITRGMCLETIISRAPSKAIQSDQEFMDTNSAEHVCLCPLPLDMSVSSLILGHDKDHNSNSNSEDYPFLHHYPSLSSFCFERKNYEDPNQDSDLEMGSKSSVSSRGRLVPSSLTSFPTLPYPTLPCPMCSLLLTEQTLDSRELLARCFTHNRSQAKDLLSLARSVSRVNSFFSLPLLITPPPPLPAAPPSPQSMDSLAPYYSSG
jgi:hypothetical protein